MVLVADWSRISAEKAIGEDDYTFALEGNRGFSIAHVGFPTLYFVNGSGS